MQSGSLWGLTHASLAPKLAAAPLSEWKVMESWPLHQVSLNSPENTTDTLLLTCFLHCALGPEAVSPFLLAPLAFRGLADLEQKTLRGPQWVGKAEMEEKDVDIVIFV